MPAITGDILTETFDNTTDYDNSGWTASGTVDPNYTGTVLEGTQSLLLNGTSGASFIRRSYSSRSSLYLYFQLRLPNLPSDNVQVLTLLDSPFGSYLLRLYIVSSGAVFLLCGSSFSGLSVGTLSANTTYHFWLTYIKGTGADAIANVGFSTDGVRPTSGNNYAAITDGSVTANCTDIYLEANPPSLGGTWTPIFDRVALNTTQIGDAADVNVSVNLTGVAADPQIGTGTVEIESVSVTPPVVELVPGPWDWWPKEKVVYLQGVAADPRVGSGTVRTKPRRVEVSKPYRFDPLKVPPIPPLVTRKRPVKAVPPPPPIAFDLFGVKSMPVVGKGTIKTVFGLLEEEVITIFEDD